MIKAIAGRIWAVWGLISFVATFSLFYLPAMCTHLLPEPKSSDWFIRIARMWMNLWLPLTGCPLRVLGKENFKAGETYIVTCNHNSMMDVPLSSPYIPGPNKTIAKKSLARIPVFGQFYSKGSVLVDRKNENSRRESYIQMKKVLQQGIHMCIYPEGTRNKTGKRLAPFHGGAFRLAAETRTPIIPAVILNTGKVLPANRFFLFLPHRLEIHFLPAIPVDEGATPDSLRDKTFNAMWSFLEQHPDN